MDQCLLTTVDVQRKALHGRAAHCEIARAARAQAQVIAARIIQMTPYARLMIVEVGPGNIAAAQMWLDAQQLAAFDRQFDIPIAQRIALAPAQFQARLAGS